MPLVNHAFARGTPAILVISAVSQGLSSKALVLVWLERKFVISAVFVKNPVVLAGQRHGLPKAPLLGPRDICVARACADARRTNDTHTHAFPQTTLFVVSKSKLIASSERHLLVTEKKNVPPFRSPHLKVLEFGPFGPEILKKSKKETSVASVGNR